MVKAQGRWWSEKSVFLWECVAGVLSLALDCPGRVYHEVSRTMKRVCAVILLTAALVNELGWVRAAHASDDVSRVIQQLHDPDVQHRRDAARELSKITPLPPDGIEAMAGLAERQDQDS